MFHFSPVAIIILAVYGIAYAEVAFLYGGFLVDGFQTQGERVQSGLVLSSLNEQVAQLLPVKLLAETCCLNNKGKKKDQPLHLLRIHLS